MEFLRFKKDYLNFGIGIGFFDIVSKYSQTEQIKLTDYERHIVIDILNIQIMFRLYKIDKEKNNV